jgi:hypothetical protein
MTYDVFCFFVYSVVDVFEDMRGLSLSSSQELSRRAASMIRTGCAIGQHSSFYKHVRKVLKGTPVVPQCQCLPASYHHQLAKNLFSFCSVI